MVHKTTRTRASERDVLVPTLAILSNLFSVACNSAATMLSFIAPVLLAASALVSAQNYSGPGDYGQSPYPAFLGSQFTKYNLSADGIRASFIPYGARLTNLYVKDKNGAWQDIVVGYDTGIQYLHDSETNHTYFGAVVGRYANR